MPAPDASPPSFCTFRFERSPENYLDVDRITRIWQAVPGLPTTGEVHLHVTPLSGDGDQESDYFLKAGYTASGGVVPPPNRASMAEDPRVRNPWEGQTPFAAPALMLSCRPESGTPEVAAQHLRECTGETVTWHKVPTPLATLYPSGFTVLLPIETEYEITPDQAAAAWRWLDDFLLRARQRRPEHWPPEADGQPVGDGSPPYRYLPPPEPWRLKRSMSWSRSLMSFAAPGDGFQCPHCGGNPDEEVIMEALHTAFQENPEAPDLLLRAPCCGIILPFNALINNWLGFARFCLQFSGCPCDDNDLAELNNLMQTPFKIVHVY